MILDLMELIKKQNHTIQVRFISYKLLRHQRDSKGLVQIGQTHTFD